MKNTKSVEIQSMDNYTTEDLQEALQPIASLISKSEKAFQKLTPGTWQYKMLKVNLKALDCAFILMMKDAAETTNFKQDDLQEALLAFASMISKTEKAQIKFSLGTSQYTLLRNRLKALSIASSFITKSLDC